MQIKKGKTDVTVYFHLRDDDNGLSKTGLLYNSAGAVASYVRTRGARTAISLATLAAANSAHSNGGFKEVDGTNAKGLYRLDVADAAFASGVDEVIIHIGFTDVFEESLAIELVDERPGNLKDDAITAAKIAADAIGSSEFAQAAADKVWATAARALTDKAGFGLSTAGILAIWHQLTANIVTANTIGKLLKDDINATVSSRSSHDAAGVWSAGSRELSTPNNYKADVSALALEATLTAMKGATFSEATDSLEAIRNRGDAAWISATGFSTHAAADIWSVGTRALTDKTGFALSGANITVIWEKNVSAFSGAGYAGTYLKGLYADWLNGGRLDLLLDAIKAKTDNLPSGLPKNVALSNFEFLMVLSSDHITPATGKTLTEQISKDGGAFAACTNNSAEVGSGVYKINLTQAEMNADVIVLKFTETNCDQRTITILTSS
jgi:hypothetical protein